jgi:O-antigen/teichoic acid export membrane protein
MSYSGNTFISSIGGIMLKSAPTLIITRMLGLNATATWSVCAKPYDILAKILNRPMDNSGAALCEMYIRNERAQLKKRMSQMLQITCAIAGVGSMVFAFMSPAFVHLWTNGKIAWPLQNFIALGLMTAVYATMRITSGFVGISKMFGFMRYIYFLEALVLIFISWLLVPSYGVIVIPLTAIACHLLLSASLGLFYFNQSLGFNFMDFTKVVYQPCLAVLIMLFTGIAFKFIFGSLTTYQTFVLQGIVMSITGFLCICFIGINTSNRQEILGIVKKYALPYFRK